MRCTIPILINYYLGNPNILLGHRDVHVEQRVMKRRAREEMEKMVGCMGYQMGEVGSLRLNVL